MDEDSTRRHEEHEGDRRDRGTGESPKASPRMVLMTILAIVTVGLVLFPCLPPVTAERGAARATQCRSNLKQFGLALHNYHDEYGSFPPAFVIADDGTRMHSWRTFVLPYVDQGPLYKEYDFDEAWDGLSNSALGSGDYFQVGCCPSDPGFRYDHRVTNYVAVVGDETAWRPDGVVRIEDFTDGLANTILLVEVTPVSVNWFEPRDLEFDAMSFQINDPNESSLSSNHKKKAEWPWEEDIPYVHVLMADGSSRRLPASTPPDVVRALLTINGGEEVEVNWLD